MLCGVIWIFSIFVLFNMYRSIKYKAHIYEVKVAQTESNVLKTQPDLLYLNKLVGQRNKLKSRLSLFVQEKHRPSIWKARLYDIASMLPSDLVLSEIQFKPHNESEETKKKDQDVPEITIDGFMVFKNETQDIYSVDEFKDKLVLSSTTEPVYSKIDVTKNRIYKDDDELKLIFSLGYFQ